MTGNTRQTGQPKGGGPDAIALENTAYALLEAIIQTSYAEKVEHGAVICRHNATRKLQGMPVRAGRGGNSVDVGLKERNCSCPPDSTPVAFYHTHPTDTVDGGGGQTLHGDPDFSPDDMTLADDYQVVGFVGAFDGSFRRYTPNAYPFQVIDGVRTPEATNSEGKLLNRVHTTPVRLNRKVPAKPAR